MAHGAPCHHVQIIRNRHTAVRRIFEPTASDEDVTEFSHEGSPLLTAAHMGDAMRLVEILNTFAVRATQMTSEGGAL